MSRLMAMLVGTVLTGLSCTASHAAPSVDELSDMASRVCGTLYPAGLPGCSDFLVNLAIGQSFLDDEMIDHYSSEFSKYGIFLLSEEAARQVITEAESRGKQSFLSLLSTQGSLEDVLQHDVQAAMAVVLELVSSRGPNNWRQLLSSIEGQAQLWSTLFAEDGIEPAIFIRDVTAFKEEHQAGAVPN